MQPDFQERVLQKVTPQVRAILKLNPNAAYTSLVVEGSGTEPAREMLQGLAAGEVFASPPGDVEHSRAALAGLWLWHDWLAQSHVISQKITSETGSFWHAIMHRREGDFSNSKYWFARCEHHPILKSLVDEARAAMDPSPVLSDLTAGGQWRGDRFVDLVEQVHRDASSPLLATVIQLQQLEWRQLFIYCSDNQ